MFGNFCCCKEQNEKHFCDKRRDDCFRPEEHCHREHFVKETRCHTNWHREECKRDEKKDCDK